jgi:hypothetical protein
MYVLLSYTLLLSFSMYESTAAICSYNFSFFLFSTSISVSHEAVIEADLKKWFVHEVQWIDMKQLTLCYYIITVVSSLSEDNNQHTH